MTPAIEVTNLYRKYGSRPALSGLTMSLEPGRIIGLMGENGSGKTTLLKILAGLLAEYHGEVKIFGQAPSVETKKIVSFLPDTSFLPEFVKAKTAIDMFADFFPDFDAAQAKDMTRYFGLDPNQPLKAMSKGMREKMQITLAMSRRAKVYLLDEPISGVDPAARDAILNGILTNYDPDGLLLISTHLIAEVENVVDDVVFLRYGQVHLAGSADELRTQYHKSIDQIFREVFACARY